MSSSRADAVAKAKLAELAERWEDVVAAMREVAGLEGDLSVEERALFALGSKSVVGARRTSWRAVRRTAEKAEAGSRKAALAAEYRAAIEAELKERCSDTIRVLREKLIPKAGGTEARVFYEKMVGDYNRYLAEVTRDAERTAAVKASEAAYETALSQSAALPTTNATRLGLALNASVFYYEILDNRDKACALAKTAFEEAIAHIDSVPEDSYKDATALMQLLRDNITLWTEDLEDAAPPA